MLKVFAVFALALLSLATSFAIVTYWPENQAVGTNRPRTPPPRLEALARGGGAAQAVIDGFAQPLLGNRHDGDGVRAAGVERA